MALPPSDTGADQDTFTALWFTTVAVTADGALGCAACTPWFLSVQAMRIMATITA
jgi:hypothetical protein